MFFYSKVVAALAIVSLASASQQHAYHHESDRDLQGQEDIRIVGGEPAVSGEFPFMVQIESSGQSQFCGGSLIRDQFVLTAAHCLVTTNDFVRVGTLKRGSLGDDGVRIKVDQVKAHPDYNNNNNDNDVMILKLATPVTTSATVGTIALNEDTSQPDIDELLTVIGFGATSFGGPSSNDLLKVQVPTVSTAVCQSQYGSFINDDIHLCAAFEEGGKDSCQGDSGGPIFETRNGTPIQVGVVSFGRGCALAGFSGVYAKTTAFNSWIDATIIEMGGGGGGCNSDTECAPNVCNLSTGGCVECVAGLNCESGSCNLVTNTCVPVNPPGCGSDSDCAPNVCDLASGECVECVSGEDCPSGSCDPATNTCDAIEPPEGCTRNRDCAGDLVCLIETGECVECRGNKQCTTGDNLFCDKALNVCVGCFKNGNCAGRLDGNIACDLEAQVCVPCTQNRHCADNEDGTIACDKATNTCVECTKNANCGLIENGLNACDLSTQTCVECTNNKHCLGVTNGGLLTEKCDRDNFSCVQCLRNRHCLFGGTCNTSTNMCETPAR